jgi:hypothetical protein
MNPFQTSERVDVFIDKSKQNSLQNQFSSSLNSLQKGHEEGSQWSAIIADQREHN